MTQLSNLDILGITLDSFPIPTPNCLILPSKIVPEFFFSPFYSPHVCVQAHILDVLVSWFIVSPYNQLFLQPPLSASSPGSHNELQTCFLIRFTLVDCQCANLTTYQDVKKNYKTKACICHSLFCLDYDNEDCRCCHNNRAEHILVNIHLSSVLETIFAYSYLLPLSNRFANPSLCS